MSSFRGEICKPEVNGCLCGVCIHRRGEFNPPKECTHGACYDCDPERTKPDDDEGYGPVRICKFFTMEDKY